MDIEIHDVLLEWMDGSLEWIPGSFGIETLEKGSQGFPILSRTLRGYFGKDFCWESFPSEAELIYSYWEHPGIQMYYNVDLFWDSIS